MSGHETVSRFPLAWPDGWPRTPGHARRRARFERVTKAYDPNKGKAVTTGARALTVADALRRLSGELVRLGAVDDVLSTNVAMRLDGLPRSGQAEPRDPGAAVYFLMKGQPTALACDRWDRVPDNIAAIAQHIDALRRIERYGVGTLDQVFRGYAALPPAFSTEEWWRVLEVPADAGLEVVDDAYRALARRAHPDAGGSHDAMARLNRARDAARAALSPSR